MIKSSHVTSQIALAQPDSTLGSAHPYNDLGAPSIPRSLRNGWEPESKSSRGIKPLLLALLLLLPLTVHRALAQALPAASPISTGFSLPSVAGTMQYAVSASQSVSSNYFGDSGIASSTNLNGDLAFITSSSRDPSSVVFSGGRSWSNSGQPSYNYLNLSLSQAFQVQRWIFSLSDAVNYLPQTASTGLSGIPGTGDLGVNPVQTGPTSGQPGSTPAPTAANPGQGVLSGFSTRVDNTSSLSLARQITGKTSFNASGSYSLTRFLSNSGSSTVPSSPGLNTDGDSVGASLSHRIDALNSLAGNFAYSRNTYSGSGPGILQPGFSSQTASLQLSHQFTRKLSTSLAAGPQWTSIDSPGLTPALSLFANLSATFTGKFSQATLAYSRSSNSGFGVVGGAISNSVTFSTGRTFDRVWMVALTAAYTQTSNLPLAATLPFTFHTTVAGVQVSRALARTLSAYASYTLQKQSNQGTGAAVDLFSGLSNVAGFGLTFSPSAVRLGGHS